MRYQRVGVPERPDFLQICLDLHTAWLFHERGENTCTTVHGYRNLQAPYAQHPPSPDPPAKVRTKFIVNWRVSPALAQTHPHLCQRSKVYFLCFGHQQGGFWTSKCCLPGNWSLNMIPWAMCPKEKFSLKSPHRKMSGCLRSLFIDRLLFNFSHSNISMCYS